MGHYRNLKTKGIGNIVSGSEIYFIGEAQSTKILSNSGSYSMSAKIT